MKQEIPRNPTFLRIFYHKVALPLFTHLFSTCTLRPDTPRAQPRNRAFGKLKSVLYPSLRSQMLPVNIHMHSRLGWHKAHEHKSHLQSRRFSLVQAAMLEDTDRRFQLPTRLTPLTGGLPKCHVNRPSKSDRGIRHCNRPEMSMTDFSPPSSSRPFLRECVSAKKS
ncbi:unnamed protein product [Protopolystoma xenopodis]|uniref:Uncharacterized protein n=1 Tax=Protopolystoma xenopodis TaxID=117903 RepID=A0A448WH10_9PLAT|nr:unnamed protein product [Protopolystoma xenopodis]